MDESEKKVIEHDLMIKQNSDDIKELKKITKELTTNVNKLTETVAKYVEKTDYLLNSDRNNYTDSRNVLNKILIGVLIGVAGAIVLKCTGINIF